MTERLEDRTLLASDFGDAPDTGVGTGFGNYETTAVDGGPSHTIVAGLHLGAMVDGDDGTLQDATAHADDDFLAGSDDEDGVVSSLFNLLNTADAEPAITLRATNLTGNSAVLYGWIDYNSDGEFDNGTERAHVDVPNGSDDVLITLRFPRISDAAASETYARFRLSTDIAAAAPVGAAGDGEVEDYLLSSCSADVLTAGLYSVEPFLDSQGNCEQKIYYGGAQVGTVIQTPAGSITQRGRPEVNNPDGFGTSKQENVFVAGLDAAFGRIEQAVATTSGVDITASGLIPGDGGTWTWTTHVTYDLSRREVTFDGETTVMLADTPLADLNVGRFSSNYLHDFELNDGNRGNSGDMTTTSLSVLAFKTQESDLAPNPERTAHFPASSASSEAYIRVNGNINRTDLTGRPSQNRLLTVLLSHKHRAYFLSAGGCGIPQKQIFQRTMLGPAFLFSPSERRLRKWCSKTRRSGAFLNSTSYTQRERSKKTAKTMWATQSGHSNALILIVMGIRI